jgi:hypothetical protein
MRMSAFSQKQTLVCVMCAARGFLLAACIVFVIATIDAALAQPFGMTRSAPPAEFGGFAGWMLAKQAEFYRMLSSLIRAAKADGSAAYTLLGVSQASPPEMPSRSMKHSKPLKSSAAAS